MSRLRGSCLCGAISFRTEATPAHVSACHCSQCRKTSGHYWASTDVPRKALTVDGEFNVAWFRSSEKVQRGFCSTCGASLFWDPIDKDSISVAQLERRLRSAKEQNADVSVFLRADRDVPYGTVVQVMDGVKKAGIEKMGMVTEPTGSERVTEEQAKIGERKR